MANILKGFYKQNECICIYINVENFCKPLQLLSQMLTYLPQFIAILNALFAQIFHIDSCSGGFHLCLEKWKNIFFVWDKTYQVVFLYNGHLN